MPTLKIPDNAVCYVQLGRYGDLMNLLPLLKKLKDGGEHPYVMVNEQFADLLDGVSYVSKVKIDLELHQLEEAVSLAQGMFPKVVASQIFNNQKRMSELKKPYTSHMLEQWALVGEEHVQDYQRLPLIFDKRSKKREAEFLAQFGFDDTRALVVCNFAGFSSPFSDGEQVMGLLRQNFGTEAQFIDLSEIRAEKIFDLLGLYERADCLISVDTATLHLANATKLKTIALSPPEPRMQSEPRPFWVGRLDYYQMRRNRAAFLEMVKRALE